MEERTVTIQTRVNPNFYEKLKHICELRNMTMSEYLRASVSDTLENEKEVYKMMLAAAKGPAKKKARR